jgi:hypothetical protein
VFCDLLLVIGNRLATSQVEKEEFKHVASGRNRADDLLITNILDNPSAKFGIFFNCLKILGFLAKTFSGNYWELLSISDIFLA